MPNVDLPVWQLHDSILRSLTEGNQLVLVAATGSGKTTQVPQMILDAGIAGNLRIVILQPRRVAARTVATRVAWERKGTPGGEVGYQVRFDDRLSDVTRLCFVTEGILLRWLQDDRNLSDIGVILFDEFHERNLLSDVALALVKDLQRTRRPDLKIVVMSATLDAEPVARYLADAGTPSSTSDGAEPKAAPILVSEGRVYPVAFRWAEYGDERPASEQAADAVERIVANGDPGDILVFMPGMGEIQSTINALQSARLTERCLFLPLHGDLSPEDQDRAFQPSDRRKIVVATNVAETSVTIDGICHVVDAGLARVARYDAERGIQTLAIEEISRASADQRAGRAGRTAPGTCWRLWTESGHLNRPAKNTPEIQRADLAEVVLLLHSLGIRRAAEFNWLDKPDLDAVRRAERLLIVLGALADASSTPGREGESDLTQIGRQMLRLPMHPRFSRMLVEAARRGCVPAAAQCASLVSGRDLLVRPGRDDAHLKEARELFEGSSGSDFHTLMRAHQFARNSKFDPGQCRRRGVHGQTARQIEDTFRQIVEIAGREGLDDAESETEPSDDALARCLLAGFIDQLAIRRDTGSLECVMTEGRTGTLVRESVVDAPLFVAASVREVDGRGGRLTLLGMATAVKREWILEMFPQHVTNTIDHVFDRTHKRVAAIRQIRCLGLVIGQEHQREVDPAASGKVIADAYGRGWFDLPKFDHELKQFVARVNLVVRAMPDLEFPPLDGAAMLRALASAFEGITLVKEAQSADLKPHFRRHLAPEQLGWLDELLPLSIPAIAADERPLKLSYLDPVEDEDELPVPSVQVKLNDCWGMKEHPRVAEGRVPVRLWLMSPDGKRLDGTTDFPAWKASAYPKIRAAIRAKYPGFTWP